MNNRNIFSIRHLTRFPPTDSRPRLTFGFGRLALQLCHFSMRQQVFELQSIDEIKVSLVQLQELFTLKAAFEDAQQKEKRGYTHT